MLTPLPIDVHFTDQVDANSAGTGSNDDPLAKVGIGIVWVL